VTYGICSIRGFEVKEESNPLGEGDNTVYYPTYCVDFSSEKNNYTAKLAKDYKFKDGFQRPKEAEATFTIAINSSLECIKGNYIQGCQSSQIITDAIIYLNADVDSFSKTHYIMWTFGIVVYSFDYTCEKIQKT
jgi:hypothetical protein